MKRLIAVELHEMESKPTCRECDFHCFDDMGDEHCVKLNRMFDEYRPDEEIEQNTPFADCPLRNSEPDRLVREAIELLRFIDFGTLTPAISAAIQKLRKAVGDE